MLDYDRTQMPGNNKSRENEFDLTSLRPGQTLAFQTSSSTWWITATETMETCDHGRQVKGVSLLTTSKAAGSFTRGPDSVIVGRYVTIEERFRIGTLQDSTPATTTRVRRFL